jgi:hypothetical protein
MLTISPLPTRTMSTHLSLQVRLLLTGASLLSMASFAAPAAQQPRAASSACAVDGSLLFRDTPVLKMGRARLHFRPDASSLLATNAVIGSTLMAEFDPDPSVTSGRGRVRTQLQLHPKPVRSRLVSFSDVPLWEAEQSVGPWNVMVIAARPTTGQPQVLAAVAVGAGQVHFAFGPSSAEASASTEQTFTALEHLYTYLHHQDAMFRYGVSAKAAPAGTSTGSQAAAQASVARARQCMISQLGKRKPAVRGWEWASVSLEALPKGEPLQMAAQARDPAGQPVQGATVAFARGPHYACDAKTDAKGMARCTMFDVHGHGDDDAHAGEDEIEPTVVAFSGLDRGRSVLLPRTLLVQAPKRKTRHHH